MTSNLTDSEMNVEPDTRDDPVSKSDDVDLVYRSISNEELCVSLLATHLPPLTHLFFLQLERLDLNVVPARTLNQIMLKFAMNYDSNQVHSEDYNLLISCCHQLQANCDGDIPNSTLNSSLFKIIREISRCCDNKINPFTKLYIKAAIRNCWDTLIPQLYNLIITSTPLACSQNSCNINDLLCDCGLAFANLGFYSQASILFRVSNEKESELLLKLCQILSNNKLSPTSKKSSTIKSFMPDCYSENFPTLLVPLQLLNSFQSNNTETLQITLNTLEMELKSQHLWMLAKQLPDILLRKKLKAITKAFCNISLQHLANHVYFEETRSNPQFNVDYRNIEFLLIDMIANNELNGFIDEQTVAQYNIV
ncbi:hypothetical protein GJ496_008087 [Pomphorhynchus laevis]|nr:hypothetical protein GJ496_008087 [Pomphorhynchus laevis]